MQLLVWKSRRGPPGDKSTGPCRGLNMSWALGIRGMSPSATTRRALVSVDGRMELLSTRPWFKSELDTRNSREESNITATLVTLSTTFSAQLTCMARYFKTHLTERVALCFGYHVSTS
jgi:hypothetical protein